MVERHPLLFQVSVEYKNFALVFALEFDLFLQDVLKAEIKFFQIFSRKNVI